MKKKVLFSVFCLFLVIATSTTASASYNQNETEINITVLEKSDNFSNTFWSVKPC